MLHCRGLPLWRCDAVDYDLAYARCRRGSVILVVTMVIKLLMASDIMIRLPSTVSVGRNGHMFSSGASDVGSGGAGDDDD